MTIISYNSSFEQIVTVIFWSLMKCKWFLISCYHFFKCLLTYLDCVCILYSHNVLYVFQILITSSSKYVRTHVLKMNLLASVHSQEEISVVY